MAPPDLPVQRPILPDLPNRPVKTYKVAYEHYHAAQAFQATAALQKANTEIARLKSVIAIANRDYKILQTDFRQGQDDMRSMLAKNSRLKQKLREATAAGTARIADDDRDADEGAGAADGPPVPRAGDRAPVPGDDGDAPVPGAEGGADDGGEAPGPGEEQDDNTDRELAGLEMQTAEAFEKYMRKYEAAASRPDGTSATK